VTLRGIYHLSRPLNVILSVLVVLVSFALVRSFAPFKAVLACVFIGAFLTFAANSMNDYFDLEIDKFAHPDRPIPKGLVKKGEALLLSLLALFFCGIFSVSINLRLFFLVLTISMLILFYNFRVRKVPILSNITVSLTASLGLLFPVTIVGGLKFLLFPFIFAFLFHLGREILKDLEDLEVDKRFGVISLPIFLGRDKAVRVAQGVFLLLIFLTPLPYFLKIYNFAYLILIIVLVDLPILFFLFSIGDGGERKKIGRISTFLKLDLFLALLSLYIGGH